MIPHIYIYPKTFLIVKVLECDISYCYLSPQRKHQIYFFNTIIALILTVGQIQDLSLVTCTKMEEPSVPKKREQPCIDRNEFVLNLCSKDEGLAIVCETVATLYQCDQDSTNGTSETDQGNEAVDGVEPGENWKPVSYGIPGIIAGRSGVVICLFDFDADVPGQEFTINAASQYTPLSDHFSVIGVDNSTCMAYGMRFADIAVAEKIQAVINQVFPSSTLSNVEAEEASVPAAKRMKISSSSADGESDPRGDNEWVVIEHKDVPDLSGSHEIDGTDAVDAPSIFSRLSTRKKSQEKHRPMVISEPKDFKHVSHVGQDTSVSQLTKSMTASVGESVSIPSEPKPIPSQGESGTEPSSSFTEVYASGPGGKEAAVPPPPPVAPPPPPPVHSGTVKPCFKPQGVGMSVQEELLKGVTLRVAKSSAPGGGVAGSIAEELKRGIVLRPVGTLGKQLPKPPPLINHGKLLFEINTFKRNTLRHVETKAKNMTDYQDDDPNSLQSLLRAGLDKMKGKLSMRNFSRVVSISGDGNEAGFEDEFDGPLFI